MGILVNRKLTCETNKGISDMCCQRGPSSSPSANFLTWWNLHDGRMDIKCLEIRCYRILNELCWITLCFAVNNYWNIDAFLCCCNTNFYSIISFLIEFTIYCSGTSSGNLLVAASLTLSRVPWLLTLANIYFIKLFKIGPVNFSLGYAAMYWEIRASNVVFCTLFDVTGKCK